MDKQLLANSCKRFAEFVALDSPSCLLVDELALLNKHAFAAIGEAIGREIDARLEPRLAAIRAAKGVKHEQ